MSNHKQLLQLHLAEAEQQQELWDNFSEFFSFVSLLFVMPFISSSLPPFFVRNEAVYCDNYQFLRQQQNARQRWARSKVELRNDGVTSHEAVL